jgi:hypothetical protein
MSLHKFYFDAQHRAASTRERYGQATFNLLSIRRPDLSEQVRSSDMDPFYVSELSDPRWDRFVAFLEANWTTKVVEDDKCEVCQEPLPIERIDDSHCGCEDVETPNLFQEMCELAIANNLPRGHADDLLVHDKRALEESKGRPFLWLLYEHGTHIVWLDRQWLSQNSRGSASALVETMISCFAHNERPERHVPPSRWFYCDGESLVAHLQAEIVELAKRFDKES